MIQINFNEDGEPTSGLYVIGNETHEVDFDIVNNVALVPSNEYRDSVVPRISQISIIKDVQKACEQHKWENEWTNVAGDEIEINMVCAECSKYRRVYADLETETAEVYQ